MNILSKNNSIILTWIPSHIFYLEMKWQTKLQKALLIDVSNTNFPYNDLKPTINKYY